MLTFNNAYFVGILPSHPVHFSLNLLTIHENCFLSKFFKSFLSKFSIENETDEIFA